MDKQTEERLKAIKAKKIELLKKKLKEEEANRILFFNHPGKHYLNPKFKPDHPVLSKLKWENNPVQERFFMGLTDPSKKVFTITGANRISKTFSTTVCATLLAMTGKFPWEHFDLATGTWFWDIRGWNPPIRIRIVGQDWEKHIKSVVLKRFMEFLPGIWKFTSKKNNVGVAAFWTHIATGSTLEIMSNKSESDLFEGWDGHMIIYDEPPKRDNRVACARGLIDHNGIEIFAMTLLKEAWVDREVIKSVINKPGTPEHGRPDMSVFNVTADISSNIGFGITQEGVDQFSKTLKPHERKARLDGVPAYKDSIIYGEFDRDKHVRPIWKVVDKKRRIPLDWLIDIAIDFHPAKEWAVLFMATDARNIKYCIDEIFEHGSWKAIGEEILRRIKRYNYRVNRIIIDPLSKGDPQSDLKEESVFDKMENQFMAYDYCLYTANKDKEGGIHMAQDLLMTENEMPALFFSNTLVRTIYEIEGYMRDPDTGKPEKKEDDMMENMYRLCLLDTQHYPIEEEDWDEDYNEVSTANSTTGY